MAYRYDIEVDFYLLSTCNFRCSYCFLKPEDLGGRIRQFATNEEWEEAFAESGLVWMIHITGGEPFIYPAFVDLCDRLTRRNVLSINSNLAAKSVSEFVGRVDPRRIHYINAALHFDERERRGLVPEFIGKVVQLREARFSVMVSVVMTPRMIDVFPEVSARLEAHGVTPFPKVMYGRVGGQLYPAAYSSDQVSRIREYCLVAASKNAPLAVGFVEPPTVDLFSEQEMLNSQIDYRGRLCGSGYNFVVMSADGAMSRCGSGESLGNLLRRDLRLLAGPRRCDTDYCLYFCNKYTSSRFAA